MSAVRQERVRGEGENGQAVVGVVMSPVNVAIVISAISLVVSLTTLGWNIYKEFCLKPRLKVGVAVVIIGGEAVPGGRQSKIVFMAVNHGPGEITITGVTLDPTRKEKRSDDITSYLLVHENNSPFGTPLPATLKVGGEARIIIPYDKDSFLSRRFRRVGLRDSFKRDHWAPAKQLRRAEEEYKKDFGEKA
jgi:hypothetical protein